MGDTVRCAYCGLDTCPQALVPTVFVDVPNPEAGAPKPPPRFCSPASSVCSLLYSVHEEPLSGCPGTLALLITTRRLVRPSPDEPARRSSGRKGRYHLALDFTPTRYGNRFRQRLPGRRRRTKKPARRIADLRSGTAGRTPHRHTPPDVRTAVCSSGQHHPDQYCLHLAAGPGESTLGVSYKPPISETRALGAVTSAPLRYRCAVLCPLRHRTAALRIPPGRTDTRRVGCRHLSLGATRSNHTRKRQYHG